MKLSIIIPTRNRQHYCASAVCSMLRSISTRNLPSFEIVVADNSDNPSLIYELLGAKDLLIDRRLKVLESSPTPFSMAANWNRGFSASTGDWVSFVGDDDYIDPKLSLFIERIVKQKGDIDYVKWSRVTWNWPDNRRVKTAIKLPLLSDTNFIKVEDLRQRIESFNKAGDGLTPYHAAARRDRLESIGDGANAPFCHPTVDYFSGYELAYVCECPINSQRPFSIAGASIASNSAAVRSRGIASLRKEEWISEAFTPGRLDFKDLGTTLLSAVVAVTWAEFCESKGLEVTSEAKRRMVESLCTDINRFFTIDEQLSALIEAQNFVGRFLGQDYVAYLPKESTLKAAVDPTHAGYFGPLGDYLYLPDNFGGVDCLSGLYVLLEDILCPWSYVGIDKSKIRQQS